MTTQNSPNSHVTHSPARFTHAFVFDLDGVITDTARLHLAAWRALAHALALPFDPSMEMRLRGVSRMDALDLVLGAQRDNFSPACKAALAAQKNAAYVASLDGMSTTDLLPGALSALLAVRAGGWGLALASASQNAATILERLDIAPLFHHVVDATQVPRGKPAPDIFLAAAAALDVPPTRCVGIEDAVAGVTAIRDAGMVAVGVGDAQALSMADAVLPDLRGFEPASYLRPH